MVGFEWFRHVSGNLWTIGLVVGSLLNLIVHRFIMRFTWCLIGGMDASISSAVVGDVLNAAQIKISARLCTFSRGLVW